MALLLGGATRGGYRSRAGTGRHLLAVAGAVVVVDR